MPKLSLMTLEDLRWRPRLKNPQTITSKSAAAFNKDNMHA